MLTSDEKKQLNVVMLVNDDWNQYQLAKRLNEVSNVCGIVVSRNQVPSKFSKFFRIRQSIYMRTVGKPLLKSYVNMMAHYQAELKDLPQFEKLVVDEVNNKATIDFVQRMKPDLVCVSGTNLLKKNLIEELKKITGNSVLNLHTGLSPYVKGGPNCTNWCLSIDRMEWIGNTVMCIDPKIDTGAMIITERTVLTGDESLLDLHLKVMNHGHDLYVKAVQWFGEKRAFQPVPQSEIGQGLTFFTRDWGFLAILRATCNFYFKYASRVRTDQPANRKDQPDIKIVQLGGKIINA